MFQFFRILISNYLCSSRVCKYWFSGILSHFWRFRHNAEWGPKFRRMFKISLKYDCSLIWTCFSLPMCQIFIHFLLQVFYGDCLVTFSCPIHSVGYFWGFQMIFLVKKRQKMVKIAKILHFRHILTYFSLPKCEIYLIFCYRYFMESVQFFSAAKFIPLAIFGDFKWYFWSKKGKKWSKLLKFCIFVTF